jgi:hypothetical protein
MTTRGVIAGSVLAVVGCQALLTDTPKERVIVVQGSDAQPDASDAAAALDVALGDAADGSYASEVLADHPIAYFRLGEPKGAPWVSSLVQNVSGTVATGVSLGVPGALAGDRDTAASFDGATKITLPGGPFVFAERHAFSIELWVLPQAGSGTYEHLFSCETDVAGQRTGYNLLRIGGVTRFERFSMAGEPNVNGPDLPPNEWAHLLAVYDGNTLTLSIRSASVTNAALVSDVGVVPTYATAAYIGMKRDDSAHFAGVIDELAIYDYALPDERGERHYAVGVGRR